MKDIQIISFKQRKYKLGKEVKNMHLKEKIATIIQGQRTGVLSTVRNDKPHSAFMMFFHEDFVLYVATDRQSKKITDIENNTNVDVLL